uniref:Uncharacterized protein n=1 Tax=Tanacetum cinerariifolium TaxID=118510 RepID=A0A6L2MHV5_TANCI|nr:hypothetical protein [Tanacetum cinerariifolium]
MRLETTVPQNKDRFQGIIDVIKNSTCFKAFTISVKVLEIFTHQFWYTIKKVLGTDSYEFLVAIKNCRVDVEVFRNILDICPRVKGEEFTEVQDDDATLIFLIYLGYKGPLHKYTNILITRKRENQDVKTCHSPDSPKSSSITYSHNTSISPPSTINTIKQSRMMETVDVSKESKPKPAKKKSGSRSTRDVVIHDTPSAPKSKPAASKLKLKGTSRILGVPDESTVVSATSSEGAGTKLEVLNEEKDTDDEDAETESDEDEIYKYKIYMRKDVDVEMAKAKTVEHENKEKDAMTDASKPDVEKITEEHGDAEFAENAIGSNYRVKESTEFPFPSSSLSVSSIFGTQFLNSSFDISLTSVLKDFVEANVSSLMDIQVQQETPQIQSPSVKKVPVSMISKTANLPPIPEILTKTPVPTAILPPHVTPTILIVQQTTTPIPTPLITTKSPTINITVSESNALTTIRLRVAKLKKDMSELKKINLSAEALATFKSQVPNVVDEYIGSKLSDALQKTLQKHSADLIQKHFVKPTPESRKIQTLTVNLEQGSEKSASRF